MQKVVAGVGDACVKTLRARLRLLPVVAELHFARRAALLLRQGPFLFPETRQRRDERAIAQGRKATMPTDEPLRNGLLDVAPGKTETNHFPSRSDIVALRTSPRGTRLLR